ncbi:MAG: type II secretion system inner membrane protein GspF [Gammaproteobacteria bacterium]|nr:type II secretion system inner membrane protein GspF [Gammaproteobacteria bacterium]MCZ6717303.1 type II secretion system inner membrane protein GspF [Gammaproteobacteria bacterium]MCZ6912047.1 type II secretion system inner membrane protein GspF [Pseudomonadota bacterium]
MGAFEYKAVDSSGKQARGLLEGDNARQVRQLLRERHLLPLEVTEVAEKEKKRRKLSFRRGISATDLALFTRQLATLVRAGLPLEEALHAVSQQTEKPRISSILMGVRSRLMEGHPLAVGMADFPQAFPEMYRATVAAGEQSGHLDTVLERLADYAESRQILRQKLSSAAIYPIVLSVMSLLIVTGMLVFVVPKIVGIFEDSNQKLPFLTTALISVSHLVRDYGLFGLVALAGGMFAFKRWLRQPSARRRVDSFLLRLPLVARLVRGFNNARFTRTLSILSGSGVPVLESMRIAGSVIANLPMWEAVEEATMRVREGATISHSLAARGLFPPMTVHLIASGEASGKLDEMLERAADNQERELDGLIGAMLSILEPALIIVMAIFVFIIVIAILLPIFELQQIIQ